MRSSAVAAADVTRRRREPLARHHRHHADGDRRAEARRLDLQLGGIAIGSIATEREHALGTDAIRALVPFQPTTIRTFAASDTLRLYGRLFWAAKDGAADVTVSIKGAATPAPQTLHLTGSSAGAAIDATLPLAGLPSGQYMLISARLPNGRTTARAIPIEIR